MSSSVHQIGSLCEDCLQFGLTNYLKPFYINLDEQIIKCESSQCMFPYLRKSIITDLTNSKPSENSVFLDEFFEQSLQQINEVPAKSEILKCHTKVEKDPTDPFDFSAIFMDHPIKTEIKEKPLIVVKQEQIVPPPVFVLESKVIKNSWKTQDSKPVIKTVMPQKSRISRCLSDVKSNSKLLNGKRKAVGERIEPVLVVEPHSGKSMRPLDLIKRYIKNK
ncbi:uncharacterized protein LOC129915837 [Episyrphus balteatus]|uniref:uncharacterized protein LOC129915837 n=1 Tax=Episyrphus balteatus TaxID=286459 RepID=UPI0024857BCF|nr:uncharacterized protein LOC129915837 [Episyrphus balteatus]